MSAAQVDVISFIPASPDRVWEQITTLDGVNRELMPILRMTAPPGARLDDPDLPLGRPWFRSRLLLGGKIPVGYSDLTLERVEPGRGFLERSPMTGMRLWEHGRTLEPREDGCLVHDRIRAQTLLPLPDALVAAGIGAVFRHRHRRLMRAMRATEP